MVDNDIIEGFYSIKVISRGNLGKEGGGGEETHIINLFRWVVSWGRGGRFKQDKKRNPLKSPRSGQKRSFNPFTSPPNRENHEKRGD